MDNFLATLTGIFVIAVGLTVIYRMFLKTASNSVKGKIRICNSQYKNG